MVEVIICLRSSRFE